MVTLNSLYVTYYQCQVYLWMSLCCLRWREILIFNSTLLSSVSPAPGPPSPLWACADKLLLLTEFLIAKLNFFNIMYILPEGLTMTFAFCFVTTFEKVTHYIELLFSVNAFSASSWKAGRKGLGRKHQMVFWVRDPLQSTVKPVGCSLGTWERFLHSSHRPFLTTSLTLPAMIMDLPIVPEVKNDTNIGWLSWIVATSDIFSERQSPMEVLRLSCSGFPSCPFLLLFYANHNTLPT